MSLFPSARPAIRVRILPRFPVDVSGTNGVAVDKSGMAYTFRLNLAEFNEDTDPTQDAAYVVVIEDGVYSLVRLDNLPALVVDKSVTYAKIQDVTAFRLLGRADGDGTAQEIEIDPTLAMDGGLLKVAEENLSPFEGDTGTGGVQGVVPAPVAGDSGKFLSGNGTWANPTAAPVVTVKKAGAAIGTRTAINLIEGSGVTITAADDAGNNEVDVTLAAVPLPNGTVIGSVYAELTTYTSVTSIIPVDDTIPQSTEGTLLLSASITVAATTSKVHGRVNVPYGLGAAGAASVAVFRSGVASALRARVTNGGTQMAEITFEFEDTPGVTTPVTYTVRVGPGGGTMYINGNNTARFFGGSSAATLAIEEIKA